MYIFYKKKKDMLQVKYTRNFTSCTEKKLIFLEETSKVSIFSTTKMLLHKALPFLR